MNEGHTPKKVFNAQPIGTRRRGRPNLRWTDGIEKDILVLRTRIWRTQAGRRLAWKRLLEKARLCNLGPRKIDMANTVVATPLFCNPFDEAHFWLNGYVNKQNCRIWSEANPQVYVETPLHPEKLTVWCALWAGGILLQKR
ncbi:uncharacterized protein TNCV_3233741 [Trichonephila clavipes]|nr:uncharacterized protein TNCV_3233741 [Trichonephila clavipes]